MTNSHLHYQLNKTLMRVRKALEDESKDYLLDNALIELEKVVAKLIRQGNKP